jgi:predicted dehydrogenase
MRDFSSAHHTRDFQGETFMADELKIGIIGFDTSHVPAFTKLLNDASDPYHISGARVVAGVPTSSPDLESSYTRVEGYTKEVQEKYGVAVVDSIEALLEQVDAVLLESVDGRRHLAEATPVIKARKPLFIDKPLADNYDNAAAIVRLAKENGCPIFSSSSLRYDANLSAVQSDSELGEVTACDAFSPAKLDPSNPGLFWYGIHGVEILYSFMGAGCSEVFCHFNEGSEVVVGTWADGRLGTMRGLREAAGDYGATVYGTQKVAQASYSREVPMYGQLLKQVVPFLRSGSAPVAIEETLEIMAFMQAALVSSQEKRAVKLSEIQK